MQERDRLVVVLFSLVVSWVLSLKPGLSQLVRFGEAAPKRFRVFPTGGNHGSACLKDGRGDPAELRNGEHRQRPHGSELALISNLDLDFALALVSYLELREIR